MQPGIVKKLNIQKSRLQNFSNSHKYFQIKMFNKQPGNFINLPLNSFKTKLVFNKKYVLICKLVL